MAGHPEALIGGAPRDISGAGSTPSYHENMARGERPTRTTGATNRSNQYLRVKSLLREDWDEWRDEEELKRAKKIQERGEMIIQVRKELVRVGLSEHSLSYRSENDILGRASYSHRNDVDAEAHRALREATEPDRVVEYLRSVPDDALEWAFSVPPIDPLADLDNEYVWDGTTRVAVAELARVAPEVSVRQYRVMGNVYLCVRVGDRNARFMERGVRPTYLFELNDLMGDLPDGAGEDLIVAMARAYRRGMRDGFASAQEAGYDGAMYDDD